MSNFVVLDFFEVCRDGDAGARVWVVVPGVVISHYPRRVNPDFEETAVKAVCGRLRCGKLSAADKTETKMSDHARVQRSFGSMLVASDDAGGIAEVSEAAAYKRRWQVPQKGRWNSYR